MEIAYKDVVELEKVILFTKRSGIKVIAPKAWKIIVGGPFGLTINKDA